jgi:hypothetical protein
MAKDSYGLRSPFALDIREGWPALSPSFRAHPENRGVYGVLEAPGLPPALRHFLVHPSLATYFANSGRSFGPRLLAQCTTLDGGDFLFSLPLAWPGEEWGRNELTLRLALHDATRHWVRVAFDEGSQGYRYESFKRRRVRPRWPGVTFDEVIQDTFRDRFIDSLSHPVLRRARGKG